MNNNVFTSSKKMAHHFLKPYFGIFLALVIVIPVAVICGQLIPWYVAQIITLISENGDKAAKFSQVLSAFYKLTFFTISSAFIGFYFFWLLHFKCIAPAGVTIVAELFEKMLKKDCRFWNTHSAGNIWGKIMLTRRTLAAQSSLGNLFYSGYAVFCSMLVILFLLYRISPSMVPVFILAGGIPLALYNYVSNNIKKASMQEAKFETSVFGKVVNTIANVFILKIFGSEIREQKNLEKDFDTLAKAMQKKNLINEKNACLQNAVVTFLQTGIILYAVYLWTNQQIQTGDVVYIITAASEFSGCVNAISWVMPFFKSRSATLKQNIKDFQTENEIVDAPLAKRLKITNGEIEIKNLTFSYNKTEPVLHKLSLLVKPKEKIGIIGLSGSGKTTLLHLLLRLINTPKGTIFIDGQDITEVTQESLHQALGFVPQDTSLFHRTIIDNIKYGRLKATDKEAKAAATAAFADNFIQTFPLKYKTPVGDKGIKLSGGERQRIGIARALLKNAPILLLDEATAALDSLSETYIQQATDKLVQNKTVIVVAHRLSTLKNMDRIIVLDNGKIVEAGTPQQLLKHKGKFAKLWALQKGEDLEETLVKC